MPPPTNKTASTNAAIRRRMVLRGLGSNCDTLSDMEHCLSVVIPKLRHIKPAGRNRGTCRLAVAARENVRDLLGRELSFRRVDHGACHRARHVYKKAVGADAKRNQIPVALDLIVVDRAHGGLDLRTDRADSGKVVRADKLLRRTLHDGLVEVLGVKPRAVDIKRVLDRGIIDQIGILLFDARADGIEAVMHLHRAGHDNIARQMRVEGVGNPVDRDARVGAEVCHVDLCMHACVPFCRSR